MFDPYTIPDEEKLIIKVNGRKELQLSDLCPDNQLSEVKCLNISDDFDGASLVRLPDLSALTNLQSLDLSFCKALQSLPDLSKLASHIKSIDLRGTPLIGTKRLLVQTNLETYDDDDPEFVAWVLAQTRPRVSAKSYFRDFGDWCALIPRAKDSSELLRVVAEGYLKCNGPDAPGEALEQLIAAAVDTELGKLNPAAWQALFNCFELADPAQQTQLEQLLAGLPQPRLAAECLGPALGMLGTAGSANPKWACALVAAQLDRFTLAELRPLAADICLFYHRMGQSANFRHWLHAFTDPRNAQSTEPIHTALALDAVAHNDLAAAQIHLRSIPSPPARDCVLEKLIPALAATHPLEAGAALESLFSAARQAEIAQDLLSHPAFTAEPANLYRLLFILQDDPECLAKLVQVLIDQHPNSPFATGTRAAFADDTQPVANLPQLAQLLERSLQNSTQGDEEETVIGLVESILSGELKSAIPSDEFEAYLQRFRDAPTLARTLLRRALIENLAEEELITDKKRKQLLNSIP